MPKKGCITTFSGVAFNLTAPLPDMIRIEDIAHHLSMVCRWAGATTEFFSVAQHSVLVSRIAPPELKKWALLHDAAEAYIGDLTRPLKAALREFIVVDDPDNGVTSKGRISPIDLIERQIMVSVAAKFDIGWPEPPDICKYDDVIQKIEGRRFVRGHDGDFHARDGTVSDLDDLPPGVFLPASFVQPLPPKLAERMFLTEYRRLFLDDDGM